MTIERAENDLMRARSDVNRLTAQLRAATERVMKLEYYLEVARDYGVEGAGTADRSGIGGGTLVQAVTEILRERGVRQQTRHLVEELERRGHVIGGANKITNLSSALSRSALSSNRTEGWGLKEWEIDAGTTAESSEDQRPWVAVKIPDDEVPY